MFFNLGIWAPQRGGVHDFGTNKSIIVHLFMMNKADVLGLSSEHLKFVLYTISYHLL